MKNSYKMKPDVNIEDIEGIREGGSWINKRDKYFITRTCGDEDITLNIGFPDDLSLWDDFDDVIVLDENFCQPYYPFYDAVEKNKTNNIFAMNVIGHYNKIMNSFPFLEKIPQK